jgi:hypothetical protein
MLVSADRTPPVSNGTGHVKIIQFDLNLALPTTWSASKQAGVGSPTGRLIALRQGLC